MSTTRLAVKTLNPARFTFTIIAPCFDYRFFAATAIHRTGLHEEGACKKRASLREAQLFENLVKGHEQIEKILV
jgi:hypothetical protein